MRLNSEILQRGVTLAVFKLSLRPHTGTMSYSYSKWTWWLKRGIQPTHRGCACRSLLIVYKQTPLFINACQQQNRSDTSFPACPWKPDCSSHMEVIFSSRISPKVHAKHYATHQNQTAYRGPSDTEPSESQPHCHTYGYHHPPTQSAKPPRRPANLVCPCICSPRQHPHHAFNIHMCDFRLGIAGFVNRNRWSEDICAGRSCLSCQKTYYGAEIPV